MSKQAGFTLIELVLVIVILGIMAAMALPRFADVENSARRGAFQGAVGAMASAVSIAKAVNRTGTPTVANVIAQFDGAGDFTAAAGACPGTATALSTTAGTDISITANFNSATTYCVSLGYAAGVLTKPTDL